jgi:hypothetical protein
MNFSTDKHVYSQQRTVILFEQIINASRGQLYTRHLESTQENKIEI